MQLKSEEKMDATDVKAVVAEVLAEQKRLHNDNIDEVVLRTIATILTSFGIEEDDRKELQADFRHLRKWRKSVEGAQTLGFRIIVGTIISGFMGAVWLGFKTLVAK